MNFMFLCRLLIPLMHRVSIKILKEVKAWRMIFVVSLFHTEPCKIGKHMVAVRFILDH